jgi:hypothetical protein
MDDYLRLISELPLPTVEQTRAFANQVANAHSWYKHLPVFPPGRVFIFFLDPQAGRSVKEYGGRREFAAKFEDYKGVTPPKVVIQDIVDRRQCGHYSTKPTREYLDQFGHWNYAHCSWEDFPTVSPRVWSLAKVDLGSDAAIEPFDVPMQVIVSNKVRQQCYCQLTAFIRGYAMYRCPLHHLPTFLQDFSSYLETKPQSSWANTLRKLRRDLEEAGLFGWQRDTDCHITIEGKRSGFRATEFANRIEQPPWGRNLHLEFHFDSLEESEHSAQWAALEKGLKRSRELFAKVCRQVA